MKRPTSTRIGTVEKKNERYEEVSRLKHENKVLTDAIHDLGNQIQGSLIALGEAQVNIQEAFKVANQKLLAACSKSRRRNAPSSSYGRHRQRNQVVDILEVLKKTLESGRPRENIDRGKRKRFESD